MTTNSLAESAPEIANAGISPQPYLIPTKSQSDKETVNVYREKIGRQGWIKVTAALAPALDLNLITRKLVRQLGADNHITEVEDDPSPQFTGDTRLQVIGCVKLSISFKDAGNDKKSWRTIYVVVEAFWIDLMLGKDLCAKGKIQRDLEIGPIFIRESTKEEEEELEEAAKVARAKAAAKRAKDREYERIKGKAEPQQGQGEQSSSNIKDEASLK